MSEKNSEFKEYNLDMATTTAVPKEYNLDMAATTAVSDDIVDTVTYYLHKYYNPSALYIGADEVRNAVEGVRKNVAETLGVSPEEIIFTSGGSESNCLAIRGILDQYPDDSILITTPIEHKSIMEFEKYYPSRFKVLPVNQFGFVNIPDLKEMISNTKQSNIVISIQTVNNEIGTRQHIEDIAKEICFIREKYPNKNIFFHTDSTQFIGHANLNEIRDVISFVDMCTFSGHKIGAPKGIGVLVKKKNVKLMPLIFGTQEHGLRGGTENVAGIMALGRAVADLSDIDDVYLANCWQVRNLIYFKIKEITPVRENGWISPNILSITFKDERINGEVLVEMLNLLGVYVSLGSACSQRHSGSSHVLKAIGLSEREAMRTIRISFDKPLDVEEIDEIIERFRIVINKLLQIAESTEGE